MLLNIDARVNEVAPRIAAADITGEPEHGSVSEAGATPSFVPSTPLRHAA